MCRASRGGVTPRRSAHRRSRSTTKLHSSIEKQIPRFARDDNLILRIGGANPTHQVPKARKSLAQHGAGGGVLGKCRFDCESLQGRQTSYNQPMSLTERVQKEMVDAMRSKEELRLSTLRMMKAALQMKRIDKRADLDEKEELQVFTTMIKQRKDSIEQFEKGNRPELAAREAEEITIIEGYMPKAVGEEEIVATVKGVIAEMGSPTMKD